VNTIAQIAKVMQAVLTTIACRLGWKVGLIPKWETRRRQICSDASVWIFGDEGLPSGG